MRADALNMSHVARTGSFSIGVMQIDSRWFPILAKYGINAKTLLDACTSIDVGAWILADLFRRFGETWEAVGAYNASCTTLKGDDCRRARMRYAWRVYRAMQSPTCNANGAGG